MKSAFLNAALKEVIFIEQPTGFINQKYSARVYLLLKALYGLKQSAREWYFFLAGILKRLGFETLGADQSIFRNKSTDIIICAHIDDLLVFGLSLSDIGALKAEIAKQIEITNLGDISFFLGIQIMRDRANRAIYINQTKFTKELIDRFRFKNLKPYKTPAELGIRLDKNNLAATPSDIQDFQRQIGLLIYLITSTRPNLSYAVGLCARFINNPSLEYFRALNQIWRYILYTIDLNIIFSPYNKIGLGGYCNID